MKVFFKYQVLTAFMAFLISYLIAVLLLKNDFFNTKNNIRTLIKSTVKPIPNINTSSLISVENELNLISSLSDKSGVTVFGSSELSSLSEFAPQLFIPQKFKLRVNTFGHAFQQSFAIYCQLLARSRFINRSKIVIILSPGWFEEDGTNIEAFLEFVPKNFLINIAKDQDIPLAQKIEIGKYLAKNISDIENPSRIIKYFINLYYYSFFPVLNSFFANKSNDFETIAYSNESFEISNSESLKVVSKHVCWDSIKKSEKNQLMKRCKSNHSYICDSYFQEFLKKKNGEIKKGNFDKIDILHNQEFDDFKVLVKYLHTQKCNVSFVLQPLNPYHFKNLEYFDNFSAQIEDILKKKKMPFLNLFTSNKSKYVPGTLEDIMHFGDYGWIEVNKFILDNYEKK